MVFDYSHFSKHIKQYGASYPHAVNGVANLSDCSHIYKRCVFVTTVKINIVGSILTEIRKYEVG